MSSLEGESLLNAQCVQLQEHSTHSLAWSTAKAPSVASSISRCRSRTGKSSDSGSLTFPKRSFSGLFDGGHMSCTLWLPKSPRDPWLKLRMASRWFSELSSMQGEPWRKTDLNRIPKVPKAIKGATHIFQDRSNQFLQHMLLHASSNALFCQRSDVRPNRGICSIPQGLSPLTVSS